MRKLQEARAGKSYEAPRRHVGKSWIASKVTSIGDVETRFLCRSVNRSPTLLINRPVVINTHTGELREQLSKFVLTGNQCVFLCFM